MDKKRIAFSCNIDQQSFEKLNSEFTKVKIRVAYAGRNRNGSSFSKELLEKMASTSLKNIPIVGHYIEGSNNFGGHDISLEVTGNGIDFKDLTRPYGVVPENTEVFWETLRENDGFTEHEYLTCTGILWSGRYPDCETIIKSGSNQSMEVSVLDYDYDENNVFVVKDAEFSALCILGKDEDPDKNIEPCFEQASINVYSLDSFKSEYFELLDELKKINSLDDSQSNNSNVGTVEDGQNKDENSEENNTTDLSLDNPDDNTDVTSSVNTEENTNEPNPVDYQSLYETQNAAYIELQTKYDALDRSFVELSAAHKTYVNSHTYENSEVELLINFKKEYDINIHKNDIDNILSQFEELNNNDEFKTLTKKAYSFENTEELLKECYAIFGRSVKPNKPKNSEQLSMKFNIAQPASVEPYGGLFLEFGKK